MNPHRGAGAGPATSPDEKGKSERRAARGRGHVRMTGSDGRDASRAEGPGAGGSRGPASSTCEERAPCSPGTVDLRPPELRGHPCPWSRAAQRATAPCTAAGGTSTRAPHSPAGGRRQLSGSWAGGQRLSPRRSSLGLFHAAPAPTLPPGSRPGKWADGRRRRPADTPSPQRREGPAALTVTVPRALPSAPSAISFRWDGPGSGLPGGRG